MPDWSVLAPNWLNLAPKTADFGAKLAEFGAKITEFGAKLTEFGAKLPTRLHCLFTQNGTKCHFPGFAKYGHLRPVRTRERPVGIPVRTRERPVGIPDMVHTGSPKGCASFVQ